MRYLALACDYDGTLATHGRIDDETILVLRQLLASGRKLLLVTGREIDDLKKVCPHLELFNLIVAENGALLYDPHTQKERVLTERPSQKFIQALKAAKVEPLSVGRAIVATWHPHETTVLHVIRELGLELQVIFNKGAVMILPSGVNKGTGLKAAIDSLGLSWHNVVGVGDAENDHAFLSCCECSAAVSNALDSLKQRADIITTKGHGAGVAELIHGLLKNDLQDYEEKLRRHELLLGRSERGEVRIPPYGPALLISGPSGSGKSSILTGILERLHEARYQFCLIDPEGDFEELEGTVKVGDAHHAPAPRQILDLIEHFQNPVVNLLGVPINDRPGFFASLLPQLQERRASTGRPHWLVIDEAHHMFPASWQPASMSIPQQLFSTIFVTVHPDHVSPAVHAAVRVVLAVGEKPLGTLAAFAEVAGEPVPQAQPSLELEKMQALAWFRANNSLVVLDAEPGKTERQRHRRKYAEGDIHEKSFHFRGPEDKLNLRAQNLSIFIQIAEGIDDETWMFHLRQQDYSKWIEEAIKDEELAREVAAIETRELSAAESRKEIKEAIERQYTSAV
jgi:HAD superfamily hydrolase (TIGR01484 family)